MGPGALGIPADGRDRRSQHRVTNTQAPGVAHVSTRHSASIACAVRRVIAVADHGYPESRADPRSGGTLVSCGKPSEGRRIPKPLSAEMAAGTAARRPKKINSDSAFPSDLDRPQPGGGTGAETCSLRPPKLRRVCLARASAAGGRGPRCDRSAGKERASRAGSGQHRPAKLELAPRARRLMR